MGSAFSQQKDLPMLRLHGRTREDSDSLLVGAKDFGVSSPAGEQLGLAGLVLVGGLVHHRKVRGSVRVGACGFVAPDASDRAQASEARDHDPVLPGQCSAVVDGLDPVQNLVSQHE